MVQLLSTLPFPMDITLPPLNVALTSTPFCRNMNSFTPFLSSVLLSNLKPCSYLKLLLRTNRNSRLSGDNANLCKKKRARSELKYGALSSANSFCNAKPIQLLPLWHMNTARYLAKSKLCNNRTQKSIRFQVTLFIFFSYWLKCFAFKE